MRTPTRIMLLSLTSLVLAALLLAGCGGGAGGPAVVDRSADRRAQEPAGGISQDEQARSDAALLVADLDVVVSTVGATGGSGLPATSGIACDRAVPATCAGSIVCPATKDAPAERAAVCAWLFSEGRSMLLQTPRTDEICTEIYGGPEVATVTGIVGGANVDMKFARTNGCEIGRFDAISSLWTGVVPTQAGAGGAAAGACPVMDPNAPASSAPSGGSRSAGGSLADDTSCGTIDEPDAISDPPEAFR